MARLRRHVSAHVLSNPSGSPSLDAANTKNVTGVAYGSGGVHVYCFDLSFTPNPTDGFFVLFN